MGLGISIKKRIGLELFRKYRQNVIQLHELTYLFWECTLRCNLNCLHCGSDCTSNTGKDDMPLDDFLNTIDQISPFINPNKTTIVITGGEPLLRKDLEICGLELYKRGFPWGIVSNGYALTPSRFKSLLNSGMRSISISLDGLENSHNWLRNNPNSYGKATNAIKLLPGEKDLKYDVVTCVNQINFHELGQLKELLIHAGIEHWRLFTIFPVGRASENDKLQLSDNQFIGLMEFIKDTRLEKRINVTYGCEGFLGKYENEVRDSFFFCRAGINIGSVLVDGSISACPSLRDNFIQGNIYSDNFMDVWNKRFKRFRDRNWTKTGVCSECSYFRYCNGNGLHLRNNKGELLLCHLEKLNGSLNISV